MPSLNLVMSHVFEDKCRCALSSVSFASLCVCRLRERLLGASLQQSVSMPKRWQVQPHHGRLRLHWWLPGVALRGAVWARLLRQAVPATLPVSQRRHLQLRDGGVHLCAGLLGGFVSAPAFVPLPLCHWCLFARALAFNAREHMHQRHWTVDVCVVTAVESAAPPVVTGLTASRAAPVRTEERATTSPVTAPAPPAGR